MIVSGGDQKHDSGLWIVSPSVAYYFVQDDRWEEAPSLQTARKGHSSVVLGTSVYVICGSDGTHSLSSIECLDLAASEPVWRFFYVEGLVKRNEHVAG